MVQVAKEEALLLHKPTHSVRFTSIISPHRKRKNQLHIVDRAIPADGKHTRQKANVKTSHNAIYKSAYKYCCPKRN